MQYGAKTAATSMVAHLVQKHEISVPEYLTEKASQHYSEKQLSVKSMFAQISDSTAVQKELIVVAYCMNPSVPFSTLDNKYWRAAAFKPSLRGIDVSDMNQEVLKYAKSLDDSSRHQQLNVENLVLFELVCS